MTQQHDVSVSVGDHVDATLESDELEAEVSSTLHDGIRMRIDHERQTRDETFFAEDLGLDYDAAINGRPDPEVAQAGERLKSRYIYRFIKRVFDIVFSLAVLILFSWLFILVAILIKLDDPKGPVLYKQERVRGMKPDGTPTLFMMYKFRTMIVDADTMLDKLAALNEKTGPVFKIKKDPRVTKVGRVLRKLSIDELPQFFNCLLGQCSVVGPRPALLKEFLQYSDRHKQRLLAKPGLTCYWQTRTNRDVITFDEWIDLDMLYVKQCSVWADTKLIVQTVGCMLSAQGS